MAALKRRFSVPFRGRSSLFCPAPLALPVFLAYERIMKANEVDILIIPGSLNPHEDHWQSRWEAKLSTARRIFRPAGAETPLAAWADAVAQAGGNCARPVLLVAHGLGVAAAAAALPQLAGKICGGFFVAPADAGNPNIEAQLPGFVSYPGGPLSFPSIIIASRNDALADFAAAEKLAETWHSLFLDAGESGHIDAKSGHGPWPEGLMVFSQFLANLPEPGAAKADANAGKADSEPADKADKKREI